MRPNVSAPSERGRLIPWPRCLQRCSETYGEFPNKRRRSMARDLLAPRFTVTVTEERVTESEKRSSSHCMIAEAGKKEPPEAPRVAVCLPSIPLTEKGRRYLYLTPRPGH